MFDPTIKTEVKVILDKSELKGRTDICKAKIESISITGEMTIKFSTHMKTGEFDLSHVNSSFVEIYMIPAEGRE